MGTEKLPGFTDALIKRSFAEAYTAFTEEGFRRRMDKERRVEDLVLIFYSSATKALQKGKTPDDDSWKAMVDRHVALFVRLIAAALKALGSDRDKPELMTRLARLESKLLTNDQDLTAGASNGSGSGTTVEVIVPISQEVKDMPLVLLVGRIFGLKNSELQGDIDSNKHTWTEEAALTDLKSYQHCLNAGSKRTLRSEDFDLEEGYQTWQKSEVHEISQMLSEILKARPELVKSSSTNKALPSTSQAGQTHDDLGQLDLTKSITGSSSSSAAYHTDPTDASSSTWEDDKAGRLYLEQATYTFTPADPRSYFKSILIHAMVFDQIHTPMSADGSVAPPLSRQSAELMTEIGYRWRIPYISRQILFLDAAAQKFLDREIGLDELDAVFEYVKKPQPEAKKGVSSVPAATLTTMHQSLWTMQDFALHRHVLSSLYDALLRDLYDTLQHCYEAKPPSPGPILLVLESHITADPAFSENPKEIESYRKQLEDGLRDKAAAVYRSYLEAEIPHNQEEWQFFHVVQLGKAVVKVSERIKKRYQKNPAIMGVEPLATLVETIFPSFENDAKDLIERILHVAQVQDVEVALQDGFDLYRELCEIRQIHRKVLPKQPFAFNIEDLLADFVWRWIRITDSKIVELVDQAIKHDQFRVRTEDPTVTASDDERHSESVIDVFRIISQTVDQIFQLEWDNDVQYAKFMTALSRSFGIALARYCEVVEQRFTKEMDRLSPAQELAAQQTKQEKWMQLAKDAWNNKERTEPFHFYPEVRLLLWKRNLAC